MSFLDSVTPAAAWERVAEIANGLRIDLRTTLYIAGAEKSAEWIHSLGPACDEQLRLLLPPIPPVKLRSITAAPEEEMFLWTGASDISYLLDLFQSHRSTSSPGIPRILDFGCGCGRLCRYLNSSLEYCTIASDVNPDMVSWCKEHLANVQTMLNAPEPPLGLPDHSVDFIYALSVFTHLNKGPALRWLQELGRILAPGGLLAATTHGYPALEIIRVSEQHQRMFSLNRSTTESIVERLAKEGHIFLRSTPEVTAIARAGEDYGNAFISPDFAPALWSEEFQTVAAYQGGLRQWQDVYLLRRK